ncbi:DUF2391 family protein [Candidatus Woesearchaeota archaeon]|nr:DUF2391 family protein [Candidatus Woesearchaeota archaeon]
MAKIDDIKKGVDELRERLLIAEPEDFSIKDLVYAFFGALLLGLTFAVKGLLIRVSQALTNIHVILIVISTLLILTAEIYFIGYSRVAKKKERKFGQFWLKRILAFYCAAVLVAFFLIYVFGLNNLPELSVNSYNILKLAALISMPCAIGAAISDLLKEIKV